MFTDELKQRQIVVDMSNRVILQNQPVKESLDEAAKAEQAILDTAK
jgi:multiple sugar transport system substrate-binding protein